MLLTGFVLLTDISDETSVALRLVASGATFLLLTTVLAYVICHFWKRCSSLFMCRGILQLWCCSCV